MYLALAIGIGFVALVIGLIFAFRSVLENAGKKILASGVVNDGLTKKYPDVDIDKYSGLLSALALVISLGMILTAFEWKTYDELKLADLGQKESVVEEIVEIPQTQQTVPPPPKIVMPEIVEVPNEEEIDQKDLDINVEVTAEQRVEAPAPVVKNDEIEEEKVDEIFTIVEEGAEPDGGYDNYYKYIKKTLKYPSQARRMGTEGKVFVQFVVDKDGSVTEAKVIKGIGAGCDEEALRVIQGTKWKPGKQRGRAVKQRIVMPISFKLG